MLNTRTGMTVVRYIEDGGCQWVERNEPEVKNTVEQGRKNNLGVGGGGAYGCLQLETR